MPESQNQPTFHVIFRACDKVHAVHNGVRPFGLSKLETIKLSFHSLCQSLQSVPKQITVIGDSLSPEAVAYFKAYPDIHLVTGVYGSAKASLGYQFDMALTCPDDTWVYLCEDDYLHVPETFERISWFIARKDAVLDTVNKEKRNRFAIFSGNLNQKSLFIHPADYPDRYHADRRYPSYLFEDGKLHWRQIRNTTHTFMATARDMKQHQQVIRESITGFNDDILFQKLYTGLLSRSRALCVSPMPGLATHLTDGVMTPIVDWQAVATPVIEDLRARGLWATN